MKATLAVALALSLAATLAGALPSRASDLPHPSAGWAFLEIARPANADEATWVRAIRTAEAKLRRLQVTDGSTLHKELQRLLPNATVNDLNDRLARSLTVAPIAGSALIEVSFRISDDSSVAARATTLIVEEFLRRTAEESDPRNAKSAATVRLMQPVSER